MFTPTWGNDPIWLIFFKWVETTNQIYIRIYVIVASSCWWFLFPFLLTRNHHKTGFLFCQKLTYISPENQCLEDEFSFVTWSLFLWTFVHVRRHRSLVKRGWLSELVNKSRHCFWRFNLTGSHDLGGNIHDEWRPISYWKWENFQSEFSERAPFFLLICMILKYLANLEKLTKFCEVIQVAYLCDKKETSQTPSCICVSSLKTPSSIVPLVTNALDGCSFLHKHVWYHIYILIIYCVECRSL